MASLQFSTHDLPERDRVTFWREVFGRHVVRLDIEPQSGELFEAEACVWSLQNLRIISCASSTPTRLARTRELLSDGDDDIALYINIEGPTEFSQRAVELPLERGSAVAILHAESCRMAYRSSRFLGVRAPLSVLRPITKTLEDRAGLLVPRGAEALRLLVRYVELLGRDPEISDPEVSALAATHLCDLMALVLGATRDAEAVAVDRGVRAARLKEVKLFILANLASHDLSVRMVAQRHRLTPRYIHMLFEGQGTTFSVFVLQQRLMRAYRMLTSPCHARSAISSIAFAAGFGDLSNFNRCFRRHFGTTPTQIRNTGPSNRLAGDRDETIHFPDGLIGTGQSGL